MISFKRLSVISAVASLMGGILLPLALGVRDPELMAIIFSLFMGAYGVLVILTTFVIRPGLRIKARRQNGVTVVRYELRNQEAKNGES